MHIMFVLLSKRAFSHVLKDVISKQFSLAPLDFSLAVFITSLIARYYPYFIAYAMYKILYAL